MAKKAYNIIKINSLPSTWTDRDEVLLHASFQILTDFIEKEKPFEHFNINESQNKEDWLKLKKLYKWWKKRKSKQELAFKKLDLKYPKSKNTEELSSGYKKYQKIYALDIAFYKEDTDKIKELADLRKLLWT